MMKMQESLFRNLFDSLLTNVKSTIDGVIKDLAELKSSLQHEAPKSRKRSTLSRKRSTHNSKT